jgi:hypothetical protein
MKRTNYRFALVFLLATLVPAGAWAQFPKIPKISKKLPGQSKSDDAKTPQGPLPELTSVTPDSVPPGGSGELVLAGKNLVDGVRVRIGCKDYQNLHIDSIKIESRERANAHVTIPDTMGEGPCEIFLEFVRGGDGEIMPSAEGTPEIVQARSISFSVSNASTSMPVGLGGYFLVPEDDLIAMAAMAQAQADAHKMTADMQSGKANMMDPDFIKKMQEAAMVMSKMAQRSQQPQQDGPLGFLLLKGGSVSFVLEGKTIFDQPVSNVKEISKIEDSLRGSSSIFRIAFKDGKAYGLRAPQSGHLDLDQLKKKLGK